MLLAGHMKLMPERIRTVGALLKPWDPVLGRVSEHSLMDNEALYILQCQPDIPVTVPRTLFVFKFLSVPNRELRLVRCRDARVGAKRRTGSSSDSVPTQLAALAFECQRCQTVSEACSTIPN